jgi:hypothetical protein
VIERTLEKATFVPAPVFEDYVRTDGEARHIAEEQAGKAPARSTPSGVSSPRTENKIENKTETR